MNISDSIFENRINLVFEYENDGTALQRYRFLREYQKQHTGFSDMLKRCLFYNRKLPQQKDSRKSLQRDSLLKVFFGLKSRGFLHLKIFHQFHLHKGINHLSGQRYLKTLLPLLPVLKQCLLQNELHHGCFLPEQEKKEFWDSFWGRTQINPHRKNQLQYLFLFL